MDIKITKDTLDGSNWTNVEFSAPRNGLDHDKITWLQALQHKHNLAGGSGKERLSKYQNDSVTKDYKTVYIENPTVDFEKDLMLWRMS